MNRLSHDWSNLLRTYPTPPSSYQATPEPVWDDLTYMVKGLEPKGVTRATYRYKQVHSKALVYDANLENIAVTEPEIITIIEGVKSIAGKSEGEIAQIEGLIRASEYMLARVKEGKIEPNQSISDDIHMFIATSLPIPTVAFRGDQSARYFGPRVSLGKGEEFRALDARLTHAVLEAGLERIKKISHPVLKGATWAAFATYHQFYFDGNKRAGRYTMNAVLMSHGYDAILVPNKKKEEYEDVLVETYKTGDLTPHISFLINLFLRQPS